MGTTSIDVDDESSEEVQCVKGSGGTTGSGHKKGRLRNVLTLPALQVKVATYSNYLVSFCYDVPQFKKTHTHSDT